MRTSIAVVAAALAVGLLGVALASAAGVGGAGARPVGRVRGVGPCRGSYSADSETTSKVRGGTATSYDRASSLLQVCEGFGAPDTGGFHLTPAMQCAIIAAAAVWGGPVDNAGVSLGCDGEEVASKLRKGNWLGTAKGVGCGYFSGIFATSAGILAAGATSATGPGAVAVGVNTYKALLSGLRLVCGGVLAGAATQLGVKLEASHETAVALDIIRRGKCLRETKKSVVGIQWSAVACQASLVTPPLEAQRQRMQQCVDRWNAQHMWFYGGVRPSRARVYSDACRVVIQYAAGTDAYYPCSLNVLGAYVCASHALSGQVGDPPPPKDWNATMRNGGRLALDQPSRVRLRNVWPAWMRRYKVMDGYIVPFDTSGQIRPGITITPTNSVIQACSSGGGIYGTFLECGASTICFARRLPVSTGDAVACPSGPEGGAGSTKFGWATLEG